MNKEKIRVGYYAGENGDYMIAEVSEDDLPEDFDYYSYEDYDVIMIDGVLKLYAEVENPTWNEEMGYYEDETITYDELKQEITDTAKKFGIDTGRLVFPYDNQEDGEGIV